ncbi:PASTA domain-containing protein [Paenibacillus filicis]|uniref:PASTA domain-containing protein n=1 Tax=Paenibacillus gyeongsangnamensis TaxID=3388067 RepID=A0ABT4Q5X0_9BACL|nr:PASTA domain-containing protein [Paenibacillus filicis]MCZ8512276.1 PASTA domain-containing protein [Paenibacillus filicis]
MEKQISQRYLLLQPILPVVNGMIYLGKDQSLNREVILHLMENGDPAFTQRYIRQLRDVASFSDNRFLHILDMGVDAQGVFAVLKMFGGRPMIGELKQLAKSTTELLAMVFALGKGMQDALEAGIQGYSVLADNLWLSEEGQLKVINYWEKGDASTRGAAGLCRLLTQLTTRTELVGGDAELMERQLSRSTADLSPAQQEGLLELVRGVRLEQSSLASFVLGLQRLLDVPVTPADETRYREAPLTYTTEEDDEEEEAVRPGQGEPAEQASNRRLLRLGIVLACLVVVMGGLVVWVNGKFVHKDQAASPVQETPSPANPPATSKPPTTDTQNPKTPDTNPKTDGGPVEAPNLVGLSQAEAEKSALAAGLRYQYFLERNNQSQGTVFRQEPAAKSQLQKGDSVTFWVSKGLD